MVTAIQSQLASAVDDDHQVLTYKRVCVDHGVSCAQAKEILFQFVEERRAGGGTPVTVTYFVSGLHKATRKSTMALVPGDRLDDTLAAFDKLSAVHVYSVQAAPEVLSQAASPKGLVTSVFSADVEATSAGLDKLSQWMVRCDEAKSAPKRALSNAGAEPANFAATAAKTIKTTSSKAAAVSASASAASTTAAKKKPEGSFFGAAATTNPSSKGKGPATTTLKANVTPKSSKGGAGKLEGMFQKSAEKAAAVAAVKEAAQAEKEEDSERETAVKKKTKRVVDSDSDNDGDPGIFEEGRSPTKKVRVETPASSVAAVSKPKAVPVVETSAKKQKESKKKKKKSDGKDKKKAVKRSRVDEDEEERGIFSSEEEDNTAALEAGVLNNNHISDEDDDMPPAAQPRPAVHARKRRRVKKTYTNDEGYMVTEIVWESESDNDDIAATAPPAATRAPPLSTTTTATAASKPKDPVPKKPISKKVSGTATKKEAASFMSFFKKK